MYCKPYRACENMANAAPIQYMQPNMQPTMYQPMTMYQPATTMPMHAEHCPMHHEMHMMQHSTCPGATPEALEMMKESVRGEKEDELFYDYLIKEARGRDDKEIIMAIRDDERKHNRMYKKIVKELTGQDVETDKEARFTKPRNYCEGLKKALFGELKAVERYRKIREGLCGEHYRDMLFEIITDELKHATKYNYLLRHCRRSSSHREFEDYYRNEEVDDFDRIIQQPKPAPAAPEVAPIGGQGTPGMGMPVTLPAEEYTPSPQMGPMLPDTTMYTPEDWLRYITPIVEAGVTAQKKEGNISTLLRRAALAGVLVGLGYTPEDALRQVEEWTRALPSTMI